MSSQEIIWQFIRRNPYTTRLLAKDHLVFAKQPKMTPDKFDDNLNNLIKQGYVFEPRSGILATTSQVLPSELVPEKRKGKAVRLKFPKTRIYKAHAVIVKRKYIQGYKCRKCGHFTDYPWEKRKIRKCQNCGLTTYYGKLVLVKSERVVEKLTKKGREFRKIAKESAWKIKMPTLTDLGYKSEDVLSEHFDRVEAEKELHAARVVGDDKPYVIRQCYNPIDRKTYWYIVHDKTLPKISLPQPRGRGRPRIKHLTREKYVGSEKAKDAAHKAWITRRAKKQVVVGFYKDRHKKTRPITKTIGELTRTKVIQQPRTFKGVRPKIILTDQRIKELKGQAFVFETPKGTFKGIVLYPSGIKEFAVKSIPRGAKHYLKYDEILKMKKLTLKTKEDKDFVLPWKSAKMIKKIARETAKEKARQRHIPSIDISSRHTRRMRR